MALKASILLILTFLPFAFANVWEIYNYYNGTNSTCPGVPQVISASLTTSCTTASCNDNYRVVCEDSFSTLANTTYVITTTGGSSSDCSNPTEAVAIMANGTCVSGAGFYYIATCGTDTLSLRECTYANCTSCTELGSSGCNGGVNLYCAGPSPTSAPSTPVQWRVSEYYSSSTSSCTSFPDVLVASTESSCSQSSCAEGTQVVCESTFAAPSGATYVLYTAGGSSSDCSNPTSATAVLANGKCISAGGVYYIASCGADTLSYKECTNANCTVCPTVSTLALCVNGFQTSCSLAETPSPSANNSPSSTNPTSSFSFASISIPSSFLIIFCLLSPLFIWRFALVSQI